MAIVIFQHSEFSAAGRLGRILRDHGHRLDIRRLHRGDPLPADLDNIDGIITCGGPQSANDDTQPWLADEMDYLESARTADLPIIGICLGCQILGRTFGGTVARRERIEFGWHPVRLTKHGKDDIVHAGVGWETMQFHYHRDEVTALPPGAAHIASSAACKQQTWSLGRNIYAFQYHGECDAATIRAWLDDEPSVCAEAGITEDDLLAQTAQFMPQMARITERLFERIALLVVPVDRRVAGLAKEMHH